MVMVMVMVLVMVVVMVLLLLLLLLLLLVLALALALALALVLVLVLVLVLLPPSTVPPTTKSWLWLRLPPRRFTHLAPKHFSPLHSCLCAKLSYPSKK